jgi:hypothetical protein
MSKVGAISNAKLYKSRGRGTAGRYRSRETAMRIRPGRKNLGHENMLTTFSSYERRCPATLGLGDCSSHRDHGYARRAPADKPV